MTHTTTDAAEARVLPVTQADRDAVGSLVPLCFGASAIWQSNVRAGYYDDGEIVQAFARHRLATAEAASGAGEREAIAREVKRVRFLDRYGNDYRADDERLDHIELEAADRILASLPPATDPAISGLSSFPPNWKLRQMHFSAPCADDRKWHVNVYGGREGGDTFVGRGTSADEALRDAARNACTALAAAPTIPATGADVRVGETLAERDRRIYAQGRKDACEEYDLDAGKVATIPATGHAATEGEGA